jgi:hypothetical protein
LQVFQTDAARILDAIALGVVLLFSEFVTPQLFSENVTHEKIRKDFRMPTW